MGAATLMTGLCEGVGVLTEQPEFAESLAWLDTTDAQAAGEIAGQERAMLLEHFPLDGWESMTLERYALGHAGYADSLCYLLERRTPEMGSIRGGSSVSS